MDDSRQMHVTFTGDGTCIVILLGAIATVLLLLPFNFYNEHIIPAHMSHCRKACDAHALLAECKWITRGKYLRTPLGFLDSHNPEAQLHHRF